MGSATLWGVVTARGDGSPLRGIPIVCSFVDKDGVPRTTLISSDDSGHFEFVFDGTVILRSLSSMPSQGWPGRDIPCSVRSLKQGSRHEVRHALSLGSTVHGSVVHRDGGPVAGAQLIVSECKSDELHRLASGLCERVVYSGDNGSYVVNGIGDYFSIRALSPGLVGLDRFEGHLWGTESIGPLDIVVTEGSILAGVVQGEDGRPIPGARIAVDIDYGLSSSMLLEIDGVTRLGPGQFEGVSGKDGRFSFRAPGLQGSGFTVSAQGFTSSSVAGPMTGDYLVVLKLPSWYEGRVLDGEGVPIVDVRVSAKGWGWSSPPVYTDKLGHYGVAVSVEGDDIGRLCFGKPGWSAFVVQPVVGARGGRILPDVFLSPESRIDGRLLTKQGRPISQLTVTARSRRLIDTPARINGEAPTWESDQDLGRAISGPDGGFEIGCLAEGLHDLVVTGRNSQDVMFRGPVEAGVSGLVVELELPRTRSITGVILDAETGLPLERVFSRERRGGGGLGPRRSMTQSEGVFLLDDVSFRAESIVFEMSGYAPAILALGDSAEDALEFSIRMERSYSAEVRMPRGSGTRPDALQLSLHNAFTGQGTLLRTGGGRLGSRVVLGIDGTTYLHGVSSGLYFLRLSRPGQQLEYQQTVLIPEDIVDGVLYLEPIAPAGEDGEDSTLEVRLVLCENASGGGSSSIQWIASDQEQSLPSEAAFLQGPATIQVLVDEEKRLALSCHAPGEIWTGGYIGSNGEGAVVTRFRIPLPVLTLRDVPSGVSIRVEGVGLLGCDGVLPVGAGKVTGIVWLNEVE